MHFLQKKTTTNKQSRYFSNDPRITLKSTNFNLLFYYNQIITLI